MNSLKNNYYYRNHAFKLVIHILFINLYKVFYEINKLFCKNIIKNFLNYITLILFFQINLVFTFLRVGSSIIRKLNRKPFGLKAKKLMALSSQSIIKSYFNLKIENMKLLNWKIGQFYDRRPMYEAYLHN